MLCGHKMTIRRLFVKDVLMNESKQQGVCSEAEVFLTAIWDWMHTLCVFWYNQVQVQIVDSQHYLNCDVGCFIWRVIRNQWYLRLRKPLWSCQNHINRFVKCSSTFKSLLIPWYSPTGTTWNCSWREICSASLIMEIIKNNTYPQE